jgi:hypothetical protein
MRRLIAFSRLYLLLLTAGAACQHRPATSPPPRKLAQPLLRVDSAGHLTDHITVAPDSVVLHVGESQSIRGTLQIDAYDRSGTRLPNFLPLLRIENPSIATLRGGGITGVSPGMTRLQIAPLVFDTTLGRPSAKAFVTIHVVQ